MCVAGNRASCPGARTIGPLLSPGEGATLFGALLGRARWWGTAYRPPERSDSRSSGPGRPRAPPKTASRDFRRPKKPPKRTKSLPRRFQEDPDECPKRPKS
eukprot:7568135-Pyramimonas_sp.AAC.1